MKTQTKIRWVLSVILILFVWHGNMWAIKFCLTFSMIAHEIAAMVFEKMGEERK